jgi:hypothetical protein
MKKQTAVEWLGNEITNRITRRNPHDTIIIQTLGERLIELIEQAKAMEKEQITKAYEEGYDEGLQIITKYEGAQDYYTSTYGS